MDNALRLTPAGGSVTLAAVRAHQYVEFSVRDTGPGIPAEHLPHLFDRFWQGSREHRGSSGLGLAIVKGIVDAHGGRVFVESTVGEGTTFRLWIGRGLGLVPRHYGDSSVAGVGVPDLTGSRWSHDVFGRVVRPQ